MDAGCSSPFLFVISSRITVDSLSTLPSLFSCFLETDVRSLCFLSLSRRHFSFVHLFPRTATYSVSFHLSPRLFPDLTHSLAFDDDDSVYEPSWADEKRRTRVEGARVVRIQCQLRERESSIRQEIASADVFHPSLR